MFSLYKKVVLPIGLEEAWGFFSNPKNLSKITPSTMDFRILNNPGKMYPGQIIHYTVRPIFGIKMEWVTEITHVKEGEYFVDEQRVGPYAMWHHEHKFKSLGENLVEMEDVLSYQLPGGFLGNRLLAPMVKPKVENIFTHRAAVLTELFGKTD